MKEKEAKVDYREHQLVLYVEKKDGSYGPLQTGSFITKNYVDDYWRKRANLEKSSMERIRKGEITPIAFYMTLEELTPSELASRVGIPARKVRKHLEPAHFGSVTIELLRRYAEVFNVPVTALLQAVTTDAKNLTLREEKTNNPYFSILRIRGKKG